MSRRREQSKSGKQTEIFCSAQLDQATGGDIKFAQEVLVTFIASFQAELAEMENAAATEDSRSLRYYARMARAGSQTVGASRIAEICLELEKGAPAEEATTMLKKLPNEMELFCSQIRQAGPFRSVAAA